MAKFKEFLIHKMISTLIISAEVVQYHAYKVALHIFTLHPDRKSKLDLLSRKMFEQILRLLKNRV